MHNPLEKVKIPVSKSEISPRFSDPIVAKRRKGRPDKARDPQAGAPRSPQTYSLQYVEEADEGVPACGSRSQVGSLRRCSRMGVRNAG